MESDEDMVVIIVGDENEDDTFPAPIQIKEEKLNSEFDISIVKDESFSSEYDEYSIKNEYEYSYLEDAEVNPDDEEYLPDILEESSDEISVSSSVESKNNRKRKKSCKRKILKPSERKSYVNDLKEQYPELNEDQDLLITCLVEIMKSTKAPPPPRDYFVMNGIMLECVHCGVQSDSIPASCRHFQEKHGPRYLYCLACGVNFRSTTNLYKHEKHCSAPDIKTVLKARAISLGRRGRSRPFIPKIIEETSGKRYPCSECSASFTTRYTLHSHTLLHRGERPHRCRLCPAAYTSYTALSRHVKTHGPEQFVCEHCRRAFKVKAALAAHMDTHRPLKKFGCELCPKRYSQKAALLLHVNKVHKNLPPPCACQLCPKRFRRMSLLKDHMKKIHGMNIMTRKMFFKKLPTMSETQVQQAKVILKSEVEDPNYDLANFIV